MTVEDLLEHLRTMPLTAIVMVKHPGWIELDHTVYKACPVPIITVIYDRGQVQIHTDE